jgi:hypothetical protein
VDDFEEPPPQEIRKKHIKIAAHKFIFFIIKTFIVNQAKAIPMLQAAKLKPLHKGV